MDLTTPGADLFGANEAAVLGVLSRRGPAASGRHVAELAGISSNASAQRALQRLTRIGLVIAVARRGSTEFTANRSHWLWPGVSAILASPFESLTDSIRDVAVGRLGSETTVGLFGSVARGDSTITSDVDILLVVPGSVPVDVRWAAIDELHARVERTFGNPLQVVDIDHDDLARLIAAQSPLVESWRRDLIVLAGPPLDFGAVGSAA